MSASSDQELTRLYISPGYVPFLEYRRICHFRCYFRIENAAAYYLKYELLLSDDSDRHYVDAYRFFNYPLAQYNLAISSDVRESIRFPEWYRIDRAKFVLRYTGKGTPA